MQKLEVEQPTQAGKWDAEPPSEMKRTTSTTFRARSSLKVGHNRASVCGPWPRYLFPVLLDAGRRHHLPFQSTHTCAERCTRTTMTRCFLCELADAVEERERSLQRQHLGGLCLLWLQPWWWCCLLGVRGKMKASTRLSAVRSEGVSPSQTQNQLWWTKIE